MAAQNTTAETTLNRPLRDPQEGASQNPPAGPPESEHHGMEHEPSLGQQIAAHTNRPHKGDVGRPGTNEEIFQGSKQKELK
jgi:hypothetical protein